jgi:NADPH:quinone reductase-like Zn-dependent oxidoreductase
VLAAAGGVGIAAIQIAKGRRTPSSFTPHQQTLLPFFPLIETRKALGARVIAAASPNKLDVARVAGGADVVVDYTTDGWQKYVMHITGGRGVDVVYDPVGKIKGL